MYDQQVEVDTDSKYIKICFSTNWNVYFKTNTPMKGSTRNNSLYSQELNLIERRVVFHWYKRYKNTLVQVNVRQNA